MKGDLYFIGQLHLHCGIVYWLNCDEVFALSTTFSFSLIVPKVEQHTIIVYIFNYKNYNDLMKVRQRLFLFYKIGGKKAS